jgi:hypothetical protein
MREQVHCYKFGASCSFGMRDLGAKSYPKPKPQEEIGQRFLSNRGQYGNFEESKGKD